MTEPTRATLRRRERELAAELASRRTTSEIQAEAAQGATGAPAAASGLTTSEQQVRVARGLDDEDDD